MSKLPHRYDAIRTIAAYCGAPGEVDGTLRQVLAAAESVLPGASLQVLLRSGERSRSVRSNPRSAGAKGRRPPSEKLVRQILACTEPCSVTIRSGKSSSRAWAVPLGGALQGSGALVCGGTILCEEDKEFLATVAQCLSMYVSANRPKALTDPAKKRIEEIATIYEISQAFENIPIEDLLKLITRKAAAVMGAQACSLMLKDPQRDELVIKASYGLSDEIVEGTRVRFGKGVAGKVAQTGQPMLLANLQDDPRFANANVTPRPDIVSSICVPLRDEESRVQGVLSIRRRSSAAVFDEEDVKLFSVFASQAALAISNAELYGSLKERVEELSTLYEASRELSGAYSVEDAARALVGVGVHMVGRVSAILLVFDGQEGATVQAASRIPVKLRKAVADSISETTLTWMHGLREPYSLSLEGRTRRPSGLKTLRLALQGTFAWVSLVPLVAEDTVVGVLMLGHKDAKGVPQQRIRLLSVAASQAATVIKNASRYEEQMEEKVLELSALYELSERISTAGTLKEALDSVLEIVRDVVWYDESFISTVDYERSVMIVQACRGMEDDRLRGAEFALSEDSLSSWAIRERKALVSPDIRKDPRFRSAGAHVSSGVVRSLMAIPLIVHDEVVGVLNVHGYAPGLYTEANVRTLSVIASQAAALYKELEALSALASYTDNILGSVAAGVLTLDRDSRVLTWNKAAEDIIGIPAEAAVGRIFPEVVEEIGVSEADKERIFAAIGKVLETGENFLGYKQEYHPIGKEPVYVNMNIAQLRDHLGETLGLVIVFEDVTNEIQMEDKMRRISELAAIGQLAASIAHELRNPLSSIKGAAQYLINEYEDHKAVREFLDIIIDEVNVLNKVTTDFLDFARPTKLNLRETDVNDVVFRTLQLMRIDIAKQGVEVEQHLAYDIPRISADDKQLEQVFRNIILNALQAMPSGGTLVLRSEGGENGVEVTVSDTGVGIPEEQQDRIFIPFFTTKTKGTGLGLAIVQKIVDNHGGRISARSVVGEGTTFEIFLPISSDRARAAVIQAEGAADRGDADLLRRAQAGH